MKLLKDILPKGVETHGDLNVEVHGLTMDSRAAGAEINLFAAIKGTQVDGHDYIAKAVESGANVIIAEHKDESASEDVTWIISDNSAKTLGEVAAAFHDNPSAKLKVIGVTGTNGKTTVSSLLHNLFTLLGEQCGLLSTVEYIVGKKRIPSTHTTPDSIRLQAMLSEMVDAGCTYCFMEVSSHALQQERVAGLRFAGALFTNITHDHLDYHGTFRNYLYAKKLLFDCLDHAAFALVNRDDKNSSVLLQNCKASKYTYALKRPADFKARLLEHDFGGMLLELNGQEAWYKLVGTFNAYNLLAVYGAAFLCEFPEDEIITQMTRLESVEGRFQYIKSPDGITAIVDYAQTPDALENVLSTINTIRTNNEQLITVVGCGGDRDKEKRPLMARTALKNSTKVILTSDNPRFEDPKTILKEMEQGAEPQHFKKMLTIEDRENAIKTAISLAEQGDIILIAGKGHETYQEIEGVKHPFDDREIFNRYTKTN